MLVADRKPQEEIGVTSTGSERRRDMMRTKRWMVGGREFNTLEKQSGE
jgi:hypothetical protein